MTKKITSQSKVYTYRNGKKIYLKKEPDQLVVRAKPEDLAKIGITDNVEKVLPIPPGSPLRIRYAIR